MGAVQSTLHGVPALGKMCLCAVRFCECNCYRTAANKKSSFTLFFNAFAHMRQPTVRFVLATNYARFVKSFSFCGMLLRLEKLKNSRKQFEVCFLQRFFFYSVADAMFRIGDDPCSGWENVFLQYAVASRVREKSTPLRVESETKSRRLSST